MLKHNIWHREHKSKYYYNGETNLDVDTFN